MYDRLKVNFEATDLAATVRFAVDSCEKAFRRLKQSDAGANILSGRFTRHEDFPTPTLRRLPGHLCESKTENGI